MQLPTKILVPTDLRDGSEVALDYALGLAGALGARVYLLHVVALPIGGFSELGQLSRDAEAQLLEEHQRRVNALAEARGAEAMLVRRGDPRDEILHASEGLGAELLVLATHGRRGLARAVLGSVAESVVRTSSVPVITVHPAKA
jgi:nucleotide-binding universal stress UspA family protein